MTMPSLAMRCYGTTQQRPESRPLLAGPWSASLIDGALHEIRYRGIEVIRMIAFLVRDRDWGTCRPSLGGIEIDARDDAFRLAWRAHCENPDGHVLDYSVAIGCAAGGSLALRASVVAQSDFLTARCGFCVLHPIDGVAGAPARVERSDGRLERATFPALIDPWQPFKEIRAIEHDLSSGLVVRCAFTGDVFEMEDQRNWSDASFKTYSRPLEWPWPYVLEAGETVEQSVTLSVDDRGFVNAGMTAPAPLDRHEQTVTVTLAADAQPDETMPALGIAIAADEVGVALARPTLLADLAPQQLAFCFDPPAGHGLPELEQFARLQRACGIPAVLEYALPGVAAPSSELAQLAAQIRTAGLALTGIVVSPSVHRQSNPPGSASPPCPPLDEVYRAARETFPHLRIGGGVLSYFTELNRKRPPLELVDWVTHATCPIVHAADDRSVMQTLEAIPHITRSCRALIGAQAYAIGPVSIGMRQNPYGSRVMPNPRGERIAMAGFDPRQRALFGAAWLAGYAAALAGARVETLTLGALTGERGLACDDGTDVRYPAFHVAVALAGMAGDARVACADADAGEIACVASRDASGRIRVLAANLTDRACTVRFALDGANVSGNELSGVVLDAETITGSTRFASFGAEGTRPAKGMFTLGPYGCLFATRGG